MTAVPAFLAHQVQALVEDLTQAQAALTVVPPDARLAHRIGNGYETALEKQRRDVLELQRRLATGEDHAQLFASLRSLRRRADRAIPETLSLIQATLTRQAQLAVVACELADDLLDDLELRLPVEWRRFTVVAPSESVSGPADIIRLRFPEVTVWSLPIVAHEFGHYVIRTLTRPSGRFGKFRPLKEQIDETIKDDGVIAARQLEETIADVFALLTVGPCFAMTCLYQRFDPTDGTDIFRDHPGDAERMEAMLYALKAFEAVPISGMEGIAGRLREDWDAARKTAGGEAITFSPMELDLVHNRIDALIALLVRHLPPDALYRGWPRAEDAANAVAAGSVDEADLTPWDVINAGWQRRLELAPDDAEGIRGVAQSTVEQCRRRMGAAR